MIKCFWFWKLLKQSFIILLISCFGFLGNSFVNWEWIFHNVNEEFTVPNMSSFTLKVLSSSAWILNGGWMSAVKPLIVLQSDRNSTVKYRYIYFRWKDKKLYAYWNDDWVPWTTNSLEYLRFDTFYRFAYTWFVNCTYSNLHNSCGSEWVSAISFYDDTSLKWEMTRFAYYFDNSSNNYTAFCWVYDDLDFSICVKPSGASTTSLTPVAWLSQDPVEFDSNLIWTSPWTSWNTSNNNHWNISVDYDWTLTWINYESFDYNDLISYYENNPLFKYDKNICYVWTNNLTALYWTNWISFQEWQGKTIFELYASLYWQNNTTVNEIWKFMNAWWINDITWFKGWNRNPIDDSVIYNAYYSLGSWFYLDYSDNLTNPFVNNLVAIYFMAENITDYSAYTSSEWDSVALYCYYKLWTENNPWIEEWEWFESERQNAWYYIVQQRRNKGYFSGASVIVSQAWSWTILDYLSGDEENLEFDTFFSKSFNRFKGIFSNFNVQNLPGVWVLPTYIILFLMAIILFRFLSH